MNKFEELLAKYGKTADEVTFEYENLSDEELEVAFKEAFEEDGDEHAEGDAVGTGEGDDTDGSADTDGDDENDGSDDGDNGESSDNDGNGDGEDSGESSGESEEKFVLQYELSHDDIRSALYNLLGAENEDNYYYAWILEVYDDKFIYQDYLEGKFYRRGYSKDSENVSLDDNKVEVFNEWLSKAEKDALDALKSDYAVLKEFKTNYDESVIKAQKTEILDKAEYGCLVENEEFTQLRTDMDKYSVEEISTKADLIFAAHMKTTMEFAAKDEGKKKPQVLGFSVNTKNEKKKKAYGKLFD